MGVNLGGTAGIGLSVGRYAPANTPARAESTWRGRETPRAFELSLTISTVRYLAEVK